MLTLFSVPKPFLGEIGAVQRQSLQSWAALGAQIVLLGNEEGVAEAALAVGAVHVGGIERTEHGTPRLDSALAEFDREIRAGRYDESLPCLLESTSAASSA